MADEYIKRSNATIAYKNSLTKDKHRTTEGSMVHFQEHNHILHILEKLPAANVVEIPNSGIGDISDGYHTFNELYHHRAVLFSVICNANPEKAWKSKSHDTGDMFDGMFIVGIETSEGQATYHYDLDPYWDMFKVKELATAPAWDGHTSQQAIERIRTLSNADKDKFVLGRWDDYSDKYCRGMELHCSVCGERANYFVGGSEDWWDNDKPNFCPNCGAKMEG